MASCCADDFLTATSIGEDDNMDWRFRSSLLTTPVCDTGTWVWIAVVIWSTINKSSPFSEWMQCKILCFFLQLASLVRFQITDPKALLRSLASLTNIRRRAARSFSNVGNVIVSPSAVTCPPIAPFVATSSSIHWSNVGSMRTPPCRCGKDGINPIKSFFHRSPPILSLPSKRVVINSVAASLTWQKERLVTNFSFVPSFIYSKISPLCRQKRGPYKICCIIKK